MKKKVGELYDKPIVIGNPNEFTKDEIPLNELKQGTNQYLYFSVDYDDVNTFFERGGVVLLHSQLFKVEDVISGDIAITTGTWISDIQAGNAKMKAVVLEPSLKKESETTLIDFLEKTYLKNQGYNSISDIPGVTPITEEEFYTI
jgi:hypothetical protein